jgi:hypothetical protein
MTTPALRATPPFPGGEKTKATHTCSPSKDMTMDTNNEILRTLGKIEGRIDGLDKRFDAFEKLAERVYKLEIWQSFLKGGWTLLVGAYIYISRQALKLTNIL